MVDVYPDRKAKEGVNVTIHTPLWQYVPLKCLFCMQLATEPVQTPTGHRFCEECFIPNAKTHVRCPGCEEEGVGPQDDCVQMGAFFMDKGAKQDIHKLRAKCMSCDFEATMIEMEDHVHIMN